MDPLSLRFPPDAIAERTGRIAESLARESHFVRSPNFTVITPADLSRLFDLYDESFFDGFLRRRVGERAKGRLAFRLAPRMTRAGGKTYTVLRPALCFEIAISSRLLFIAFGDEHRPVTVCGLPCDNRLSALQRIMEHEMLHLLERLVWDESSCAKPRFQGMARNIFGHAAHTHDLVTPVERARTAFDLRPGDAVSFDFAGVTRRGVINRINHRATVLVEDAAGRPYSNGKRYNKFYIPLGMLRKA